MQRAFAVAVDHRPNVLVMSLRVPDLAQTTQLVRNTAPGTSIAIVIDDAVDTEAAMQALAAGASAILDPPRQPGALTSALRLIADGRTVIMPAALRDTMIGRVTDRMLDPESIALVNLLSAREYEVLEHMARGLSNAKIAAALSVSEHTVKSHIKRVLQKLQCESRCAAALVAYRSGVVR
ncbi:response regulator transcription factor [Lentzea sp. NPDC051208]|uniref:helix-turn-helix transcriptional regulator n=1 Tax=Lentzea sp. NPDC051208 TaxID=3154642 RepID=UPI00342AABEF